LWEPSSSFRPGRSDPRCPSRSRGPHSPYRSGSDRDGNLCQSCHASSRRPGIQGLSWENRSHSRSRFRFRNRRGQLTHRYRRSADPPLPRLSRPSASIQSCKFLSFPWMGLATARPCRTRARKSFSPCASLWEKPDDRRATKVLMCLDLEVGSTTAPICTGTRRMDPLAPGGD